MKYIKVKHSKRQILSLGFCVILICFFIYIGISPLLSNGIFFKSPVFVIPVAIFLLVLFLIYIDYIVYTINVEYNQITVKRLFSNKTYYLDSIEYILSSPLSSNRKYQIDNSINKNKFKYTIYFENGKVNYNDNMDNSAEFLKILLKYSYVDRPLSR